MGRGRLQTPLTFFPPSSNLQSPSFHPSFSSEVNHQVYSVDTSQQHSNELHRMIEVYGTGKSRLPIASGGSFQWSYDTTPQCGGGLNCCFSRPNTQNPGQLPLLACTQIDDLSQPAWNPWSNRHYLDAYVGFSHDVLLLIDTGLRPEGRQRKLESTL